MPKRAVRERPQAVGRGLVEAATDHAGLTAAIKAMLAPKTGEAYGAVFDLVIDPPALRVELGPQGPKKLVAAVAMGALERVGKRNALVQEVIISRCEKAPLDSELWEGPLLLLWNIALADKPRVRDDKRAVAGLRRSLEWKDGNVAANAADALGKLPDPASLPLMLARLATSGPDDHVLCWSVAEAFGKLGGTASDLPVVVAARDRLREPDAQVDKELAKLTKRLSATAPSRARRGSSSTPSRGRGRPRRRGARGAGS